MGLEISNFPSGNSEEEQKQRSHHSDSRFLVNKASNLGFFLFVRTFIGPMSWFLAIITDNLLERRFFYPCILGDKRLLEVVKIFL
jgi:hypothetical protein